MKTLLYYDLFHYPLLLNEIITHCTVKNCDEVIVQKALDRLYVEGLVFRFGEFYGLQKHADFFLRRMKGNEVAANIMSKAKSRSGLISAFPFVRCVCISGSLSKGYFDESTDVDFFIITQPNRLWICRTLLVLFKKVFLFNSKKYFCVNYFIDSASLRIPDQNIFTATEIATLLPVYNYDMYLKFFSENDFVESFFPNVQPKSETGTLKTSQPFLKSFSEKMLSGNFGEWLDKFFFKRTISVWRKRFGLQLPDEFELNMRSRRNVSKHHPQGFQFQVLKRYQERIREFEESHAIKLGE